MLTYRNNALCQNYSILFDSVISPISYLLIFIGLLFVWFQTTSGDEDVMKRHQIHLLRGKFTSSVSFYTRDLLQPKFLMSTLSWKNEIRKRYFSLSWVLLSQFSIHTNFLFKSSFDWVRASESVAPFTYSYLHIWNFPRHGTTSFVSTDFFSSIFS